METSFELHSGKRARIVLGRLWHSIGVFQTTCRIKRHFRFEKKSAVVLHFASPAKSSLLCTIERNFICLCLDLGAPIFDVINKIIWHFSLRFCLGKILKKGNVRTNNISHRKNLFLLFFCVINSRRNINMV